MTRPKFAVALAAAASLMVCCGTKTQPTLVDGSDAGSEMQADTGTGRDVSVDLGSNTTPDVGTAGDTGVPDAGSDTGTTDPALEAAITDYATAICEHELQCVGAFQFHQVHADMAQCVSIQEAVVHRWMGEAGATTTTAEFDACAGAYSNYACGGQPPAECRFTGSLTAGTACTASAQCQSGFCAESGDMPCGECATPTQEGDDCLTMQIDATNSFEVCTFPLECGTDVKCHMPSAVGEACDIATCDGAGQCIDGTCVALGVADDACDPADPTLPRCAFAAGVYCEATTHMCTPYAASVQLGGDCDLSTKLCAGGLACDTGSHTCVPRVGVAGSCVRDLDCAVGLFCDGGVCVPLTCGPLD